MIKKLSKIGKIETTETRVSLWGEVKLRLYFEEPSPELLKFFGECIQMFKTAYPDVKENDLVHEFSVIHSIGVDNPESAEYTVQCIVWKANDEDKALIFTDELALSNSEKYEVQKLMRELILPENL